jgi:hypothetical protein
MEWHHMTSSQKKKFNAILSASKIMATVFWDCEGVILIDVLFNSDVCGNSEEAKEAFPEGSSP